VPDGRSPHARDAGNAARVPGSFDGLPAERKQRKLPVETDDGVNVSVPQQQDSISVVSIKLSVGPPSTTLTCGLAAFRWEASNRLGTSCGPIGTDIPTRRVCAQSRSAMWAR